jgi:tetratricopeptide (TPR) repeat protein
LFLRTGKLESALESFEECLEIVEALLEEAPDDARARFRLVVVLGGKGFTLLNMKKFEEAISFFRKAMEYESRPEGLNTLRVRIAYCMARSGDHESAAAEIEKCVPEQREADPYNVGCALAVCSGAAARDESLTPEERSKRAEDYAKQAVACIGRAIDQADASGRPELRRRLEEDADFEAVRGREDFREALGRLSDGGR